ncbi:hypothetical protein HYX70_04865 [Candidatus Saccharibacteria bacterium]|nr:hypothetical protein [Candidatus Saccharibacteria bacterium]
MKTLEIIGLIALSLLVLLFVAFLLVRAYYGWRTSQMPEHSQFASGTAPTELPNGSYKGTATVSQGSWQGKKFDSATAAGINVFAEGDKYEFKMSSAKGLTDPDKQVLKIDYNLPSNPWWLRLVVDEVVQTGPNELLGKIQINAIPSLPFTVGYFKLQK